MKQGEEAFGDGSAFEDSDIRTNRSPDMTSLYEEAVRLKPDNAKA
jgi:hypothetical protein